MVVVPRETPVTTPLLLTVATDSSAEVKTSSLSDRFQGRAEALSWAVRPCRTSISSLSKAISAGTSVGSVQEPHSLPHWGKIRLEPCWMTG